MKRRIIACYDANKYYNLYTLHNILVTNDKFDIKYILAVLNSNILNYYFASNYKDIHIKPRYLSELPIPELEFSKQKILVEYSNNIIEQSQNLNKFQLKVINMLRRDFGLEKPTKKLEAWYELSLQDFFKELLKAKINLTAIQKDEMQDYFETYQKQAIATKNEIVATDKAIDKMVYELYGLSEEEIKIVEES